SYVAVQAVLAAIADAPNFLPQRRAKVLKTRHELCEWFGKKNLKYIEPQANFVMFEVGRASRPLIAAMAAKGVAAGRPFPPLDSMIRVSIGTDRDMERFREVFWSVYNA
ncbi:MAG: aminotransferase class I/II-fold pyridoxal phosphate-dependent enzyme, partial [Bryobacteraceae bacterium]